jgi:hypothetical protein
MTSLFSSGLVKGGIKTLLLSLTRSEASSISISKSPFLDFTLPRVFCWMSFLFISAGQGTPAVISCSMRAVRLCLAA